MSHTLHRTLFAVLLAIAAPFAGAGELVPFRSSGVAQLLDQPVPGGTVQGVDTGRATHFGNFTSVYDLEVSLDGAFLVFTGTFTSTVSSGDTITFALEVTVSLFTGTFEGEFSAIGGTGRFAGIEGGLVTTLGVVDPATGIFSYDSKGFLPSVGATKRKP